MTNKMSDKCRTARSQRQAFSYRYRVDNVPVFLRPLFYLYGYGAGLAVYLYFWFVHLTSSIEIEGLENLSPHSNYIFCCWHGYLNFYFATFLKHRRYVWMNHPYWYMKPFQTHLRLTGVKEIILGSTGHHGKQAADQIIEYLKRGYSTVLYPDGPSGPRFKLRKGILHMSLQSEVPIIPINIRYSRFIQFNQSWDKKRLPLPFSNAKVVISHSIQVNKRNFDDVGELLALRLSCE